MRDIEWGVVADDWRGGKLKSAHLMKFSSLQDVEHDQSICVVNREQKKFV